MWQNGETNWMWRVIHQAEARMKDVVKAYPNPSPEQIQTLNRMVRQLLHLQTSDWLFHVTLIQEREYAISRFYEFYELFDQLSDSLKSGQHVPTSPNETYGFDDVDYRWFIE